jgi:hypothetical protein
MGVGGQGGIGAGSTSVGFTGATNGQAGGDAIVISYQCLNKQHIW